MSKREGNKGTFGEYGTLEIKILIFEQGHKATYLRGPKEQLPTAPTLGEPR